MRTDRWRLIRVNSEYDLYDFEASPYEVSDVSGAFPNIVSDLAANKLNVQSARTGTTNFNTWRTAHFTAEERTNASISGLQADPDLDGAVNILELLGGTGPKNPVDPPRLLGEVRDLSAHGLPGDYFTARFTASALVDDVAFALDGSGDLANWDTSAVAFVTNSPLGGGRYEYLFRATNAVTASSHGFIRLKVEQTP